MVVNKNPAFFSFHAIRKCDSLKAPAIFLDWEDCSFYLDQDENDGKVEYQAFDVVMEALEYIYEVIKPPATETTAAPFTKDACVNDRFPVKKRRKQVKLPNKSTPKMDDAPAKDSDSKNTGSNTCSTSKATRTSTAKSAESPTKKAPSETSTTIPSFASNSLLLATPIFPGPRAGGPMPILPKPAHKSSSTTKEVSSVINASVANTAPQGRAAITFLPPGPPAPPKLLPIAPFPSNGPSTVPPHRLPGDVGPKRKRQQQAANNKAAEVAKRQKMFEDRVALLQEYRDTNGTFEVPKKENPELNGFVQQMQRKIRNEKLTPEQTHKLESIGFVQHVNEIGNEEETSFVDRVSLLQGYFETHGDFEVPKPANPELHTFVKQMQRKIWNDGLTPEQTHKLETIGFVEHVKDLGKRGQFDVKLRRLQAYHAQHGNFDVKDAEETPILVPFVRRMKAETRKFRTKPEASNLNQEQVDLLESIGLAEQVKPTYNFLWEEKVQKLQDHYTQNGCFDGGDPQLAGFAKRMEMEVRKYQVKPEDSKLTSEKYQRLESIGFVQYMAQAEDRKEARWEEMFEKARKFQKDHQGRLPIPQEDAPLHAWIKSQKYLLNRAAKVGSDVPLTTHQVVRLTTTLGPQFVLGTYKNLEERAQDYVDYRRLHRQNPPVVTELGIWARKTKLKYIRWKNGGKTNLTQEIVDRLADGGFEWPTATEVAAYKERLPGPTKKTWEERYQELVEFKERHGHTRVPQLSGQLGSWVHGQRRKYHLFKKGKKSSMNPERLGKLTEIDFAFSNRHWKADRHEGTHHKSTNEEESSDEDDASYERR
jgi:hypothetical protein